MAFWYATILSLHSWLRWGVVGLALLCIARAALGWRRRRSFERGDARLFRVLVAAVDTQIVLGLLLYARLSPFSAAGFSDLGGAMHNSVLRYFVLEHPLAMLIGVAVLHVGSVRARRWNSEPQRHRAVLRTTATALLCFAIGLPWPGLPYARPLLRTTLPVMSPVAP
jgi:hypothetical protein